MVHKLISEHENSRVEFKSSARWNYRKGGQDSEMEMAVVKTVAGFMNAKGGTLLIGVDDEGQVLGLDNDYKVTPKGNKDGFELWLTNTFMNCFGKTVSIGLDVSFAEIDGNDVCLIDVKPSSKPVFVNAPKNKIEDEFFVRMNNQTQRLTKAELLDYEKERWA